MELSNIIRQLRAQAAATFGARIAGAAEFKVLPETVSLAVPFAFVVPLDDNPEEGRSQNSVRQALRDSFAVVVALSNTADEKGQTSSDAVHGIRAVLWRALLGWRPVDEGQETSESRYDGITYEGGSLLAIDRARLWYQFEFGAAMEIDPGDGFQELELAGLPHFQGANLNIDGINPLNDPNRNLPNQPDGRIEHAASAPAKGVDLPT